LGGTAAGAFTAVPARAGCSSPATDSSPTRYCGAYQLKLWISPPRFPRAAAIMPATARRIT